MKIIQKISIRIGLTFLWAVPLILRAQPVNNVVVKIGNPVEGADSLMELIVVILQKVITPVAAVAVVVWIIWAGFTFLTAQGNPKKIEEAKARLLWSLIGAGILLGATAIAEVLKKTIQSFTE